jgi:hypothetical protein
LLHISGAKTLDQDVALLGQALHYTSPCLAPDVQGDTLFPGVQVQESGTLFRVRRSVDEGTGSSRDIPSAGRLDFDDLGTQSGQELGTEGASDILAEVKNAEVS